MMVTANVRSSVSVGVMHEPRRFQTKVLISVALGFVQNSQHLVCFRLHFLSIQTYGPNQLRIVTMKLRVNVLHERRVATSVISRTTREPLLKFAFAVDYSSAAIRQLQGERCSAYVVWHLMGGSNRTRRVS